MTTTGTELTEGKHYWEVELLSETGVILIGISRPNFYPTGEWDWERVCTSSWFINAGYGSLYGNGKRNDDAAGSRPLQAGRSCGHAA
jgi:hypothetical protein